MRGAVAGLSLGERIKKKSDVPSGNTVATKAVARPLEQTGTG